MSRYYKDIMSVIAHHLVEANPAAREEITDYCEAMGAQLDNLETRLKALEGKK